MKHMHPEIRIISCDLNGTLVHQHTMMDMIRVCFPHMPERYEMAKDIFSRQTAGISSMKDAFEVAGPLTKGLSLRNAIEYAWSEMQFLKGFEAFISDIYKAEKYFVINSTGYSVTTEVIKSVYGPEKIHDVICNRLIFGWEADPARRISEHELADLIRDYFFRKETGDIYDKILATGEVELGIRDEKEKARLIFEVAEKLGIPRTAIAHAGDTMGDSLGICEVARNGGAGIAFNYNNALKNYLEGVIKNEKIPGKIILTVPKSETSDVRCLSDILL
ncbi:hypothetical protein QUF80_10395 [Desulfococcaceae bacterium HSG8]|nr:hypothetical protein [Desulfococcaceae bacterium HSG8]